MVLFKGTNQSQARSAQWVRFPTSQLPLQLNLQKEQVKPEEIRSLIQTRGEMNDKFQSVNGRMVLWEGISVSMLNQGISRTPAQCKSLWTSLVQKYKESKMDEESKKMWPYFSAMDRILSCEGEIATK